VAYTPKAWLNFATKTTPINSTALKAAEQRAVSYATAESVAVGVAGLADYLVKQNPAGANMQVGVGAAATEMNAWVRDAALGIYRYQYNGAQLLATIGTADGTNPRVDRVCLTAPASSDSIVPQVVVLAGTPSGGATLDNLTGAQAVPTGYVLLADVLVGAGVTSITTANIRDRRPVGGVFGPAVSPVSGPPTVGTARDEVFLQPSESLVVGAQTLTPTTHDNMQGAYLAYLARRIVGATRIRWKYAQGATPAATNYNIGMADVSGRVVITSGAIAFAGGANAIAEQAATITATTFEPGWYYVWLGIAPLTAASALSFSGVQGNVSVTAPGASHRNRKFHSATGSTTFPASNTLAAYTDVAAQTAAANNLPMPLVSLAVG